MSDAEEYSSDDDGHINDEFEPQVYPTLSVDVGSGLSVRPEDCQSPPARSVAIPPAPIAHLFPALDSPRTRLNIAEP